MTDSIVLLQAGQSPRLSRLLDFALAEVAVEPAGLPELEAMALQGRRVLIALTTGEGGMSLEAFRLLQSLRTHPDCLRGATGALIVDGAGELYTKQAAQAVALAANLAGCLFPGKPLVEGTGSLYNQHILAGQLGLPWEETYFTRARDLAGRLARFQAPRFPRPRVLMLHASDNLAQRCSCAILAKGSVKSINHGLTIDSIADSLSNLGILNYGVSAVELESVQALIGIEVDNNTHVGAFLHEAKNVLTGTTVSYIHFMRFKSNSP